MKWCTEGWYTTKQKSSNMQKRPKKDGKSLLIFLDSEISILGTQSVSKSKVLVSKFFKHFEFCYDFTILHTKTCSP